MTRIILFGHGMNTVIQGSHDQNVQVNLDGYNGEGIMPNNF